MTDANGYSIEGRDLNNCDPRRKKSSQRFTVKSFKNTFNLTLYAAMTEWLLSGTYSQSTMLEPGRH